MEEADGATAEAGRTTERAREEAEASPGEAEAPGWGSSRVAQIARRLAREYPDTTVTLDHSNPLELLVATILSAQCTDERVNEVTKELFSRCRTAEDYAEIDREELEDLVRSTGFYRNKAKHIQGMATRVVEEHGGRVPDTMAELVELPGVARKTANVVLSNAFDEHEGVVVDTHVKRVARRLGLTGETRPEKVERDLMELLPGSQWHPFAWRLILHGRRVCSARSPACGECLLEDLCPSAHEFE